MMQMRMGSSLADLLVPALLAAPIGSTFPIQRDPRAGQYGSETAKIAVVITITALDENLDGWHRAYHVSITSGQAVGTLSFIDPAAAAQMAAYLIDGLARELDLFHGGSGKLPEPPVSMFFSPPKGIIN